ncbi:MAG: hypothetical protein GY716_15850 [bacterium]|nr:hypothetical protein [bacterium]
MNAAYRCSHGERKGCAICAEVSPASTLRRALDAEEAVCEEMKGLTASQHACALRYLATRLRSRAGDIADELQHAENDRLQAVAEREAQEAAEDVGETPEGHWLPTGEGGSR